MKHAVKTTAERAEQAIEAIFAHPGASKAGHILFLTQEFEATIIAERARWLEWAVDLGYDQQELQRLL